MSRPAHLPPRCPPARPNLIRFHSLDSILEEEQPSWLNELLAHPDIGPKEVPLRRSASDSTAALEAPASLQCTIASTVEGGETCDGLEGNCVYGPNSPRQKSELCDSEVTALLESIPRNPLQYVAVEYPNEGAISEFNGQRGFHGAGSDLDPEKAARRRSGQRSRVRKLQYISELERTVETYQNLGAELAAGVASLFQQRVALSIENKNLRRQITGLQQEKIIKDGHYRTLKNEAGRLKVICGRHRRSKSASSSADVGSAEVDPLGASWQMLDFGKLNLGKNTVPLRHGFGC